jgi:hypothetical protein
MATAELGGEKIKFKKELKIINLQNMFTRFTRVYWLTKRKLATVPVYMMEKVK